MAKSGESAPKKAKVSAEPRIGIFWLVDGKLWIDSVSVSGCGRNDVHFNYPGSHIDIWEHWQQTGEASLDSEYEDYPRGRVI